MAIYYHVSTDITHNGEFIPRVPSFRHGDSEDSTTARVCVSTSIEGCLSAIPNGGSGLDYLRMEQRGYFQVFKIDTDKLGIGESDVVLSEELYEKDSVRDANFTNEVWITTPFIVPMEDRELILLEDWQEEPVDVIPHFIYQLAEEKYEGDHIRCYEEKVNSYVPSSVLIKDAVYRTSRIQKGETITIEFYDEWEKDAIVYEAENLPVELREPEGDLDKEWEFTIIAKEDVDIWTICEEQMRAANLIL